MATASPVKYIVNANTLRIWSHDDQHWAVDWSFMGRSDLSNAGWVAVVTSYDPKSAHKFEREFVDKRTRLIEKSSDRIVIEYRNLYEGGSKYGYLKHKGDSGWLTINPDNSIDDITAADAVTILTSRKTVTTGQSETPATNLEQRVNSLELQLKNALDELAQFKSMPNA